MTDPVVDVFRRAEEALRRLDPTGLGERPSRAQRRAIAAKSRRPNDAVPGESAKARKAKRRAKARARRT